VVKILPAKKPLWKSLYDKNPGIQKLSVESLRMNERFSDLLTEYLEERDRQNSDYYDNRFIGSRSDGVRYMEELAQKMDVLIHGVQE
jgi:hypothetical protein